MRFDLSKVGQTIMTEEFRVNTVRLAQFAASIEATTPAMMSALLLADRFRLDGESAALLIGWTTILFWFSLPLTLALGLIR